ncbi:eukaryotic translation initiation factor 3 subunit J, partial [Syncephalis fuscata]
DDEEFEVPAIAPPSKPNWDDEDVDDDEIKESWEDSDEEKEKTTEVAASVKKKVPLAQRIAERNAENERKRQEMAARKEAASSGDEDEDPADRKKRLAALEQAADLENANDMFRGVSVQGKTADKIATFHPKTKDDFEAFKTALVERIETFKTSRFYPAMIEALSTELARSLKDVDVRKISSSLSRIANDKQREAKAKEKKKGASKKPSVQVSNSAIDTTDYGGAYEDADYDDFM